MGLPLRALLASALLLASCATPAVVTLPATSRPTASTVLPTIVSTGPPSTTGTPGTVNAPVYVSGAVYWNHHPQAGVAVQISQPAAPGRRVALASGTTLTDGSFVVAYSVPFASFDAYVPAFGPYLEGARAAAPSAPGVFRADPIDLMRAITGLSVHDRDNFKPGPLTITWDPVPEATAYCVTVYSPSTTNKTPAPRCSAVAHLPGDLVTGTTYTTPPLAADQYTIALIAITDVAIGDLAPTGIAFRVAP